MSLKVKFYIGEYNGIFNKNISEYTLCHYILLLYINLHTHRVFKHTEEEQKYGKL